MADDIDIEEHDVYESLRRKQMSEVTVKEEPLDEEYTDYQYEDPSNGSYQNPFDWEAHAAAAPPVKVEPTEEEFQFGKIILGSKPPIETTQTEPDVEPEENVDISQENYNYNMSLVLDDWGPFLQRSKCYCHECKILFATLNTLDAHKMVAHSLLVATEKEPSPERNRAVKSTAKVNESLSAKLLHSQTCEICKTYFKGHSGKYNLQRHYRNVHQVDPYSQTLQELRSWRICNHCNVYFPNDTALVKHLYELLPLNENKTSTDDKNTPVKDQTAVKSTTGLNDKLKIKTSPVKKEKNVTPSPKLVATASTVTPAKVKDVKDKSIVKYENRFILGSKVTVKSDDVEQVRKKPNIVRKCEVCGGEYTRKYYYQHMRRIHPEFLTLRLGKLKKLHTPANVNTNIRYKCNACKLVLNSYTSARDHRLKKHPHTSGQKIFKIIKTNKIQKINKPKVIVKKDVQPEEVTNIVVPKSTLFKCSTCSVHFMTCYGACAHSRVCESTSNIRDWGCPQCHKVFKNTDRKSHEFQHETSSSSKFKVFVVYLEMVVRILCECPYCYVCFEEYKFWRHINFGCERDAESFYCNECRLPVDVSSKTNHESKHSQGHFTKDDFIKVDYVASQKEIGKNVSVDNTESVSPKKATPVRNLKRKLEEPEKEAKKRKYPTEVSNLFYCPTCKCYITRKTSYHVQKKCKVLLSKNNTLKNRIKAPPRPACKYCGLCFTSNTFGLHKKIHEKYPKLTLLDLTLTRLTDDKKIKPTPEHYTCKTCNVTFVTKMSRNFHSCGKTKSIECQECQRKIEKQLFKTHMNFHNYVIPGKIKPVAQKKRLDDATSASSKSPMTQNLPELLMKYKSLTTLWNILYLCEVCDTFTDSYDKVVEHCQNHFSNMESYGVVIMKCQICNMKFDRDCYRRHLELHAGSKVITRKCFKILKYDHTKLYSPDWLNFLDLPEDQKSQILTRSIYGETRSIRLSLVQQGPPEYTVYKCLQCLNCVPPHALTYHINLQNCLKANKIRCQFCDLVFVSKAVCDKHEEVHETKYLKTDSFRIIAFNKSKNDDSFEKQTPDLEVETKSNNSSNITSNQPPSIGTKSKYDGNIKTIKGKKFFMFYKCGDCDCCTLFETNSKKHICNTKKNKTCFKCGLDFSSSYVHIHYKLHDKFDISKQNVFTKTFYNRNHNNSDVLNNKIPAALTNTKTPNENKKDDAKLYKCHCGLHYTSLKSIEKHYRAKNCNTVVRERCSQCKLIFDPLEVVNHLCKHHAQAQFKNFEIIIPTKKTLYKCNQCHILFYDERIAASHNTICEGKASGTKCEKCGLAFHGTSIETHREDHKASGVLKPDCYIVINVPAHNPTAVLYRCKICNIHFMMKTTLKDHILVHDHKIKYAVKECTYCGLKFTTKALVRHVELQHVAQKIEDFDIRHLSDEDFNKSTTIEGGSDGEVDVAAHVEPKIKTVVCEVFKCNKCSLHFTDRNTLTKHYEDRCSKELSEMCEYCDKKFAIKNFKEHVKQHCTDNVLDIRVIEHDEDTVEDTSVTREKPEPETCTYKIYKCRSCDLHFNTKKTLTLHVSVNCHHIQYPVKCNECDRTFSKHSLMKHKLIDHNQSNFEIVTLTDLEIRRLNLSVNDIEPPKASVVKRTAKYLQDNAKDEAQDQTSNDDTAASLSSSFELESTDEQDKTKIASVDSKDKKNNAEVKLYKCRDCNVYFLTQASCYKHTLKHSAMDPKDFIECKLCGFQFTIMALPTHIKRHHASDLNLEDVLVEEYQPNNLKNNVPKIEIYYAIDKYQSRLVSTTSEVKNNTAEVVDALDSITEDSEVTSNCVELTDKIDEDQQVVYAVVEEDENDDVETNDDLMKDACSELDSSDVNNKVENETDKQLHIPQD